jgi:hypothetical protein
MLPVDMREQLTDFVLSSLSTHLPTGELCNPDDGEIALLLACLESLEIQAGWIVTPQVVN